MGSEFQGRRGRGPGLRGCKPWSPGCHLWVRLSWLLQGTESRMQVPLMGSAGSTMTKGLSSSVATVRCCVSSTGCRKRP